MRYLAASAHTGSLPLPPAIGNAGQAWRRADVLSRLPVISPNIITGDCQRRDPPPASLVTSLPSVSLPSLSQYRSVMVPPGRDDTGNPLLQAAQEIQYGLLLPDREIVEVGDHVIGFRARTSVSLDRLQQIRSPSVVQEEDSLPNTP